MARRSPAPALHWPLLAMAGMEWRIGRRTAAFRLMVLVVFLFGWTIGGETGQGVALSAYATADAAWLYLGFVTVVWMSLAAIRETALRTDILVFSKPQPGERLAMAKFLGAMLQLLVFLLSMFVGSIFFRLVSGGGLPGAEVYVLQFIRASGVLFFAACASFTLALLFDNPIAGALVGLYWILTLSGKAYLGKFYFPAYTQNLIAYIFLGLGLLFITLLLFQRTRRGDARTAFWVRFGAPVCLLVAGWLFWIIIRDGHDPQARLNPTLSLMGEQDTDMGLRAAGFLLPDQNGKLTGLTDFPGKILVIALWSPQDPDSVLLLDRLNEIQTLYKAKGVQSIAICLSEDYGAGATFARGEGVQYPVITDWGTFTSPNRMDSSPLASAYRASSLPWLVVTDRRRRVKALLSGSACYDGDALDKAVKVGLTAEPR